MTNSDWNPGQKYRTLLSQLQEILNNGEDRTVRDCYYALESRGEDWDYRSVKRAVKKGRRAGYIDPSQIVDASRTAENVPKAGYESPRQFIRSEIEGAWNGYHENYWAEQDNYVEVWLEKQSLASVFKPICLEFNVRLEATRGDWSDSKVYEACNRLSGQISSGKDVHILYWGDYNPSGFHAPVSTLETMGHYGIQVHREFPGAEDARYYDIEHETPYDFGDGNGTLNFDRVALNTEDIERFDLPENPVPSSSDKDETIKKHFKQHVSGGRDTNVELNALKEFHRDYLERILRESIRSKIDAEAKTRVEQREEQRREQVREAISIDYEKLGDSE